MKCALLQLRYVKCVFLWPFLSAESSEWNDVLHHPPIFPFDDNCSVLIFRQFILHTIHCYVLLCPFKVQTMEGATTQDEIHQEEKERSGSTEVGWTDPKERGLKSHHFFI